MRATPPAGGKAHTHTTRLTLLIAPTLPAREGKDFELREDATLCHRTCAWPTNDKKQSFFFRRRSIIMRAKYYYISIGRRLRKFRSRTEMRHSFLCSFFPVRFFLSRTRLPLANPIAFKNDVGKMFYKCLRGKTTTMMIIIIIIIIIIAKHTQYFAIKLSQASALALKCLLADLLVSRKLARRVARAHFAFSE